MPDTLSDPIFLDACPDDNLLTDYLHHSLPAAHYDAIERHVEDCPLCTEVLVHLAHLLEPDASEPSRSPVGQMIGRYQVLTPLGKGGMGTVYEAFDTQLHRRIALKMVRQDLARESEREQLKKRLVREARALASLAHPHILPVYEIGEWNEQVFVAMQLVDGMDLRSWMVLNEPSWREVVSVFAQVAKGLKAAHKSSIIHRDIKPDNFLITAEDHVYLADFGLVVDDSSFDISSAQPQAKGRLTQTGMLVGTPGYIAPEMHSGMPASALTDQFAFCVSLFECLYQQKPHVREPYHAHVSAISQGILTTPHTTAIPDTLYALLQRGMDPQPNARYADMHELGEALLHCVHQQDAAPTQPERPVFAAAARTIDESRAGSTARSLRPGELGRWWKRGLAFGALLLGVVAAWNVAQVLRHPKPKKVSRVAPLRAALAAKKPTPRVLRPRPRLVRRMALGVTPRQRPLLRPARAPRPRRRRALRPRPRRRVGAKALFKGTACAGVAGAYRRLNRKGWEAFENPKGRALWQAHARCLYKRGKCRKAFSLNKQYMSLLSKNPKDEDLYAYTEAQTRCGVKPFLREFAAPLARMLRRVTPYYGKGLRFCRRIFPGLLRRHVGRIRGLDWESKERWEKLMKVGIRCLALPLTKAQISEKEVQQTCRLVRRNLLLFRRSVGKPKLTSLELQGKFSKCVEP